MEVTLDKFEQAINEVLLKYGDKCYEDLNEVIDEMSKEIPKRLKIDSPRRKGGYAKGWRAKRTAMRTGITLVVYNGKKPQLTHLLENGHAKRNGGRTAAEPHIAPVNDWAQKETIERIEKRLSE